MIAEVFLDAVDRVAETKTQFNKMSKQARAVDLPHEGFYSYFLDVFDRPPRSSACECSRSSGASLQQVLHLVNSNEVEDRLANDKGRIARFVREKTAPEDAVVELYLTAFSRRPTDREKALAVDHIKSRKDARKGLEDVAWALLNSREFMFNH
jgi:hypothetical protein